MKSGKWLVGVAALLGSACLLNGCSGFWNAPTTTSTTVTTTTLNGGNFFVLDQTTSQIIAYNIVAGVLTEVGATALPSNPLALAVAPSNGFLYVSTANGIYVYTDTSGVLSPATSPTQISQDTAVALQVDITNSWLLETAGLGTLTAIPIVSTSGVLDTGRKTVSVTLTGSTVNGLAIWPNDQYVFVALGTGGTAAYGFNSTSANPFSSTVTTIALANTTAGSALSVAVDPSSRLLYIAEAAAVSTTGGGLRAFTISTTGALKEISGSPMSSGGTGPHAILPKSSGDYVYVANWNSTSAGNITGFSLTDTGTATSPVYSLTALSNPVATGEEPVGLVEDNQLNFVIAVSALGNPYLNAYYFDTTTVGQLDTTITSSSFASTAIAAEH